MSSSDGSSSIASTKKKRRILPRFLQRFGNCSDKGDSSIENGTSASVVIEAGGSTVSNKSNAVVNDTSSTVAGDTVTIKNEKSKTKHRSTSSLSTTTSSSSIECPLCLIQQPSENFPRLSTCHHLSCMDCLRQYLTIEITESRVNVTCPECQERIHPNDMKLILTSEQQILDKWEEFMLRRTLSVDPDCRWCPAPDCGYAVIAQSCASCPKLVCERPGCNTSFCYHCRQEWHPDQTCDAAHLQRTRQIRMRNNSVAACSQSDEIKPCPKCGALIVKMNDGSCNHMTCTVCDAEFCWLCLQEITDLHYLSPSGCTFWGKKPWSRKKKILWQLGLLIGAPLGIALVAGVAVPAIIIGLPFWVARKTISSLKKGGDTTSSKHRRNLLVVTCVVGSILLSPPLAALTVGIGVPVMLIYVYGIVPFSLCRTGSYSVPGASASSNPALTAINMTANLDSRFQRLDAAVRGTGSGGASAGSGGSDSVGAGDATRGTSVAAGGKDASIGGRSEGGMTMTSLNMSHSSNLDKLARPDHDTSSTIAIAGSSITGSISGMSAIVANNRLETNNVAICNAKEEEATTNIVASSASVQVQVHPNKQQSDNPELCASNKTNSQTNKEDQTSSSSSLMKKTFSSKSLGVGRKSKLTKKTSSCVTSQARTSSWGEAVRRSNTLDESNMRRLLFPHNKQQADDEMLVQQQVCSNIRHTVNKIFPKHAKLVKCPMPSR